jgi:hypothetical protein
MGRDCSLNPSNEWSHLPSPGQRVSCFQYLHTSNRRTPKNISAIPTEGENDKNLEMSQRCPMTSGDKHQKPDDEARPANSPSSKADDRAHND